MNYPVKKVYITQEIGSNPQVYAQFGLKGHNGIDLRIYDKNGIKTLEGELYAPHDGKIIEATMDSDGYGWYYKIENDIEGSILGHNKTLFFKVGDYVKEGQHIGTTDNTGFSTGSHLHWLYYRHPRDKSNGYGGAINPRPYIKVAEAGQPVNEMNEEIKKLLAYYGVSESDGVEGLKRKIDKELEFLESERKTSSERLETIKTLEVRVRYLENNPITSPNAPETGYVINGKTITTVENNVTTTINYAVKQA
jgi:hypothetical protein